MESLKFAPAREWKWFNSTERFWPVWGPILTSPLGVNLAPRGEICPIGGMVTPGDKVCPQGQS
jgi:hypothetical protein